ncbi:hypothetical protein C0J52_19526 [Blattella germanica]|nr:hypothetical protein C0J52_19526 [Blattella germanica]
MHRFCREVCYVVITNDFKPIGGPGHTGIDRDTKESFVVKVDQRNKETLIPLINTFVLPGSKICSDGWKAYTSLESEGYIHGLVNHSIEFISSEDPSNHTQTVERQWKSLKNSIKREGREGSQDDLFVMPPESELILGLPKINSEDFKSDYRPKILKTGKPKKKSRVLVLGDRYARNCAINVKDHLTTNYEVIGIVKPGARAEDIVKTDEHNLEMNDIIVLWADTNDISKNAGACGVKNIMKFVAENYKSKILIMSAPHRYDLPEWSCINNAVNIFNMNLKAKIKRFHYAKMVKYKAWDKESMQRAITAVRAKEMGYKAASKAFSVPRATLKDYIKKGGNQTAQELIDQRIGRKPVLPQDLEDELVKYSFYGLTAKDLRRMAYQLAIHPIPISREKYEDLQRLSTFLGLESKTTYINIVLLINDIFTDMPLTIKKLESSRVAISESLKLVDNVTRHFTEVEKCPAAEIANQKLKSNSGEFPASGKFPQLQIFIVGVSCDARTPPCTSRRGRQSQTELLCLWRTIYSFKIALFALQLSVKESGKKCWTKEDEERKANRGKAEPPPKKTPIRKRLSYSSSSSEEDGLVIDLTTDEESESYNENECCGCFDIYHKTKSPVDWIKCVKCGRWLHETCTMYGKIIKKFSNRPSLNIRAHVSRSNSDMGQFVHRRNYPYLIH